MHYYEQKSLLFNFQYNWKYLLITRNINDLDAASVTFDVTQTEFMLYSTMDAFQIIHNFINLFCRTLINIGLCKTELAGISWVYFVSEKMF